MTTTLQEPAAPARGQEADIGMPVSGIVDIAEASAFVRTSGYRCGPDDVIISAGQLRQYALRKGDQIEGAARPSTPAVRAPLLPRTRSHATTRNAGSATRLYR